MSGVDAYERRGITISPQLLTAELIAGLRSSIDRRYDQIQCASRAGRPIDETIGPLERFLPTASSYTVGAAISEKALGFVLSQMAERPAGTWIRRELGTEVVCNLDQSWVRRQYAPANYPRFHAPHGWHQDGALKFDFGEHQNNPRANALLPLVTCWIALEPCGEDAPGLEIVLERLDALVPPNQLTSESVQTRYPPDRFWRPVFEPGDALLFCGNYLHRTHVTPTMTKDRTSVELRFFVKNNIPERIKSDRFIEL